MIRRLGVAAAATALAAVVSAQTPPRTTGDGVFTEEQAARGGALYQQACASCHGAGLGGAEMAPALSGPDFNGNWSDVPVGDLFERIRVSMPQDKPGSLSQQQNADIVAFILKANKAPAGQVELPRDADTLKTIRIAPSR